MGVLEDYYKQFNTSLDGLSEHQVQINRKQFGKNTIEHTKPESLLVAALKELLSFFPLLLLISGGLSFFAHTVMPMDGYNFIGYALVFVVLLNTSVSLIQKRKVAQIMASFEGYIPKKVLVIRGGEQVIPTGELVAGDIIKLGEGDKIPADALLVEAHTLQVDESILTGESGGGHKQPGGEDALLKSGTTVLQGNCTALVTAVGGNTKFGKIAHLTDTVTHGMTPMQLELKYFVEKISVLAIVLGISFFLIGVFYLQNPFWTNLIFAIGIIVANVPEGLLPTVTLALTQASQRMAKSKAVVKSLESVETLGSCSVICTDKTGTLTQNKMKAQRVLLDLKDITLPGDLGPAKQPFLEIAALCNNAAPVKGRHGIMEYYGDPTETALCDFCSSYADIGKLRAKFTVKYEKTFNSEQKFMSKVLHTEGDTQYTTIKGAPEVILGKATSIHLNGDAQPMNEEHRAKVEEILQQYEEDGLRVIALGYYTGENNHEDPHDIVFVGLIALMDPPRVEVSAAVAACKTAGIKIIVISGDNPKTVAAIARQTGIAKKPITITGKDLEKMTDKELKELLQKPELVFARTAPEQKLRIVAALQELGERVAVTGDGVNDAPALRKADIGVSMGQNGTDVAKDASDIILLDDNFATIVKAIEQGRAVFDNIKKFITYVLTSNIPEILPFLIYVLFYPHIPLALTVLQILTIDLITDILPSIALGNENPEKDVMHRKPRARSERLVSAKTFVRSYLFIGPMEALLSFVTFFTVLFMGGWKYGAPVDSSLYIYATTTFLATIIACQIANVLACRTNRQTSLHSFRGNRWMKAGILVEVLVIGLLFLLPTIGWEAALHGYYNLSEIVAVVSPLAFEQWLLVAAVIVIAPFVIFFVEELRKYLARQGVKWCDL